MNDYIMYHIIKLKKNNMNVVNDVLIITLEYCERVVNNMNGL